MQISLTLELPRDALSVPVVRRLLGQSMHLLGVQAQVVADVELALTEACTNVIDHSGDGEGYDVRARIDGARLHLEVIDRGVEFNREHAGLLPPDDDAEGGRGILLMRALVDRLEFTPAPEDGVVVHLEKQLALNDGSVLEALSPH
jgi:serine/threonine-protein kinase RsbW